MRGSPIGRRRSRLGVAAFAFMALAPARGLAGGPCLQAVSLEPAAGFGDGEVFEAIYSHCEGAQTFRVVQIWFGDEVAIDVPHVQGGFEAGVFSFGDAPGQSCSPGRPSSW